jgi:chromosomal replication initiator protein
MAAVERFSTPLEHVWTKVCATLRSEVGEQAYGSYLAHASLRRRADGVPVVVTPTGYARDWLRKNAMRRIGEEWSLHDPEHRRLELKSKLEFDAETPSDDLGAAAESVTDAPAPVPQVPGEPRAPSGLRGLSLQDRLTFDSFVEGAANRFAVDTARRVASWEPGYFNPVLIHGPWGQGKTHLLTAIAWEAQRAAPDKTVIYLTAERFLNGFMQALKERSTSAFKEELRGADLLLIDDVHFVGGKPSTQEELFHTLAWLVEEGRRVVLSADRSPAELTEVEARLRSHLCAGLVCGVQPAERTLRMAIVERRLEILARSRRVPGAVKLEVLQFLADRFSDNVRELEGAVHTVFAQSADRLGALSVDECSLIIRPHLKGVERRVTVDEIQKTVASFYGLKQDDLAGPRRTRAIVRPRQAAMFLAKTLTTRSYPDIGRRFGGRDHTTVLHAVRVIEKLVAEDGQMARDVEALTRKLRD